MGRNDRNRTAKLEKKEYPRKSVFQLTYENCDYNKDSKSLRNNANLLDLFSEKESKEKTRKMANDCDGRSQQNKPAEKRRDDRPSKNKVKFKNITLIFKIR